MNSKNNYELLNNEHPDEISVLFMLHILSAENPIPKGHDRMPSRHDYPYLHRMLLITPDCFLVRQWLLDELNFHPNYLSDPDQTWREEITRMLVEGYELSRELLGKIQFAKMLFISKIAQNEVRSANSFLDRVIRDLNVEELKYDDDTRTANLNAVCDYSAFHLRFTDYCLDAIEKSIHHDVNLGQSPDKDVLEAIRKLNITLTHEEIIYGGLPRRKSEFSFLPFPDFPYDVLQYSIRLGKIIDDIPNQYQPADLSLVSLRVLGEGSAHEVLEQILNEELINQAAQSRWRRRK